MALNFRQRRLYTFSGNLFKPAPPQFQTDGAGNTLPGAQDVTWPLAPKYKGVLCYYRSTDNYSKPIDAGRYKEENLFTTDIFYFDAAQEIGEGWIWQNAMPQSANYLQCWVMKGAPRITESAGGRDVNQCKIEAILVVPPPGFAGPKAHTP